LHGGLNDAGQFTPQYLDADKRFRQAKTLRKIGALEDMLALIPKHKGQRNAGRPQTSALQSA
jgi:hypothetical protein